MQTLEPVPEAGYQKWCLLFVSQVILAEPDLHFFFFSAFDIYEQATCNKQHQDHSAN